MYRFERLSQQRFNERESVALARGERRNCQLCESRRRAVPSEGISAGSPPEVDKVHAEEADRLMHLATMANLGARQTPEEDPLGLLIGARAGIDPRPVGAKLLRC